MDKLIYKMADKTEIVNLNMHVRQKRHEIVSEDQKFCTTPYCCLCLYQEWLLENNATISQKQRTVTGLTRSLCLVRVTRLSRLIRNTSRTHRGKTSTCCHRRDVLLRTTLTRPISLSRHSLPSPPRAVCRHLTGISLYKYSKMSSAVH